MSGSITNTARRKWPTARAIVALLLREMSTTYGRTPGGYLWAILEPVGALAVLSIAFSVMFNAPALGTNFPLFYATGYLPFMMYSQIAQKVGSSIRFSKPLLFYPAVTYLDAILARWILALLTHLSVFVIVYSGIILAYGLSPILDMPRMINALAMAAFLGLGVGTLNTFLIMMFPVWEQAWAIINRPLFIISGVFFLFESIPEPLRGLLWFNPLIHVTGEMRKGVYATYDAAYVTPIYVYSIGAVTLLLGLVFLNRYHRFLLNQR